MQTATRPVAVDVIQLPDTRRGEGAMRWCVNEFELADFASWMWEGACETGGGGGKSTMDEAVCDAHASFIAEALQ